MAVLAVRREGKGRSGGRPPGVGSRKEGRSRGLTTCSPTFPLTFRRQGQQEGVDPRRAAQVGRARRHSPGPSASSAVGLGADLFARRDADRGACRTPFSRPRFHRSPPRTSSRPSSRSRRSPRPARQRRACVPFFSAGACCTLGVGPLTKPAHHISRTAALQEKYFMENVSIGERLSTLGASLSSRPSAGPSAAGGQLTRAPSSARHPRQAPRPTSRPPCRSTARSGSTPPLRSSSAVRPYCSALLSPWAVATQY